MDHNNLEDFEKELARWHKVPLQIEVVRSRLHRMVFLRLEILQEVSRKMPEQWLGR